MGYLYYGHYAKLYEIGRSEAIRSLGISYRHLEDELKIMMPVLHVESRFKLPAYYDENITIRTIVEDMPGKLVHFKHEILNEDGVIIHLGSVKLFFIDMKTNKRVSAPPYLTKKLNKHFD